LIVGREARFSKSRFDKIALRGREPRLTKQEMTMTTIAEWYQRVSDAYGPDLPRVHEGKPITEEEARVAGAKLYRFVFGRVSVPPVRIVTGNRYSYRWRGELRVNPTRGWQALVHELSHDFHRSLSRDKPHSRSHARLELKMASEARRRGWFDGALRPAVEVPAPTPDPVAARVEERMRRLERARATAKRAATRLKARDDAGAEGIDAGGEVGAGHASIRPPHAQAPS
jgi:hypothetical protein